MEKQLDKWQKEVQDSIEWTKSDKNYLGLTPEDLWASSLEKRDKAFPKDLLNTIIEILQKNVDWLNRMRLTCSCVNWMGGCSGEPDCSYGWKVDLLKLNKSALDAILAARSNN